MKRNYLITPEGTRDILFNECIVKRKVENELRYIFTNWGYSEVITPGIEFYDVFDQSSHYFPPESMYKLMDSKGRILVMRPDSTMPIARLTATRLREMQLPIKLFYNQNIFVSNPKMTGRSDELTQAGIEIIGGDMKKSDIEALIIAMEVLIKSSDDFRLEIGSIAFFKELIKRIDINDDLSEAIRICVENKNIPSLMNIISNIENSGIITNKDTLNALRHLPDLYGNSEVFEEARKVFKDDVNISTLNELKKVYDALCEMGYENKITVDLGLVNRTDYYTGIVFRGYIDGYGDAVLSGGRYDKLIGEFGFDVPATGFAVNIDAVVTAMLKKNQVSEKAICDVIVYSDENYSIKAMKYCKELIENGYVIENSVFPNFELTKIYAENCGICRIDIVGENITQVLL